MLEIVNELDQKIVLWLNGLHHPVLDEVMWCVSSTKIWIPLFLILIFLLLEKYGLKKGLYSLLFLVAAVGLADYVCSGLMKPHFARLRPSHEPSLSGLLHFYTYSDGGMYRGGLYGFASSHAGNFFAIVMFCSLALRSMLRRLPLLLFAVAVLVSISRMYLAAHYFTDLLVGGLIGGLIGTILYQLFDRLIDKGIAEY